MDELFSLGAVAIQNLQSTFWNHQKLLIGASHVGDPKNVYLILFPAIFSVDRICGIKTLYAACISEYINLILKWLLQEDRPYWWVFENASKTRNVTLHQFPLTCETGPGSPSGHVMVSAAVWYIIVNQAVKHQRILVRLLAWLLYLAALIFVAISRMFLAAHFPHQCTLGFGIGIALGEIISKFQKITTTKFFLLTSLVTFVSTLVIYNLFLIYDLNPNKSVSLALQWCSKKEYIHLDTTPLYCSMRYSGSLLGCSLALFIQHDTYYADHYRLPGRVILTLLGIGIARFLNSLPLPDDKNLLYISSFVIYSVMFIIIAGTVPRLLHNKRVCSNKKRE